MNMHDITEEHIFKVLGKGRDPNYKSVDLKTIDINTEPFNFKKLLE